MESRNEIKDILASLLRKRRYRHVSAEKLFYIFEHVDFDSGNLKSNSGELDRIKRKIRENNLGKQKNTKKSWMLKPVFGLAFSIILIFSFIFIRDFFKQDIASYAKISSFVGSVRILRDNQEFSPQEGLTLTEKDVLVTGKGAFLELTFDETVRMRINDNSRIELKKLMVSDDSRDFGVALRDGTLLLECKKLLKSDRLRVKTDTSVAAVRGTLIGVKKKGARVRYEVYEGRLNVRLAVPEEELNKDRRLNKIEKFYKSKAVILEKNNVCTFRENTQLFSGLSAKGALRKLMALEIPEKKKVEVYQMETLRYYREFKRFRKGNGNKSTVESDSTLKTARVNSRELENVKYIKYVKSSNLLVSVDESGLIRGFSPEKFLKWSVFGVASAQTEPVLRGRYLYFSTYPDGIGVVDTLNGSILWKKRFKSEVTSFVLAGSSRSEIFVVTEDGMFYRLGWGGKEIWRVSIKGWSRCKPVISDYIVFVSTNDNILYGIDRKKGIKVLKLDLTSSVISMAVESSMIYLLQSDRQILCYNYKNDEKVWNYKFSDVEPRGLKCYNKSIFVFSSGGFIHRLSVSGSLIWKRNLGNSISIPPLQETDLVYIVTDRTFSVLGLAKGDIKWSVVLPPVISQNIAESEKNIYLISRQKGIVAFKK